MTPAHQPQQEIHDQIGKLKTDLFKCIGTIESIQSKCRDTHTSPPAPAAEFTDAENKWCDDYTAAYNRGFDAGAKAERERVLPYLEELASPSVSDARKREIIQSLRPHQQQEGVSEG